MPDTSLLSPFIVRLGGGLMLDKDAFTLPPGAATQLQNFEPDINGGYRRISGFAKYDSNQVGGSSGTILGVHIYKNQVIASQGTAVYKGSGSGWTSIDTGRTSAGRYDFANFNFNNTEKVIWCDGANNAIVVRQQHSYRYQCYRRTCRPSVRGCVQEPRVLCRYVHEPTGSGVYRSV
jgi:hypothetical protein